MSSCGSPISKDNVYVPSAVSTSSHPIIGESATVFTDMTDTMLKVLDRCMVVNAQACELENSLAENAYAIRQSGQGMTGYLQDPDSYKFTTAQPLYMNTLHKATCIGVPMAESTPVPQVSPTLFRPIPTPQICDILEPLTNELARAKYLDTQMRHMKSVLLPSSITSSDDKPLEESSLSGRIQEYCSRMEDHRRSEDTHYVTLNSIKEYKMRQIQQGKRDRDEVYNKMSQNLERVREVARSTFSRASTISAEEHRMALSETDLINIKEKMNKIDQRIDGLYQNWQAEYKEAITSEQCEEIQKFYEPYVMKYETKYKVLYQILRQAIGEQNKITSSRVSSTGLTPMFDGPGGCFNAETKEWNRGDQEGDTPHMYSTIDGRLTPTAPVYEDMQTETPLHVTTEESLEGLSAAIRGIEDSRVTQQPSDNTKGPVANVASPEVSETNPKVIDERTSQEELPRRNEVTREMSREDALATIRLFFNTVAERRSINEVPTISTVSVSQIDIPPAPSVPAVTEPAEPETTSSRMYLPSGSPPRPTATATCRP